MNHSRVHSVRICMLNFSSYFQTGIFFSPISSVQSVPQTFHRIGIFAALQISILHSWNLAKIKQGNEWTIFARLIFFLAQILYCVSTVMWNGFASSVRTKEWKENVENVCGSLIKFSRFVVLLTLKRRMKKLGRQTLVTCSRGTAGGNVFFMNAIE